MRGILTILAVFIAGTACAAHRCDNHLAEADPQEIMRCANDLRRSGETEAAARMYLELYRATSNDIPFSAVRSSFLLDALQELSSKHPFIEEELREIFRQLDESIRADRADGQMVLDWAALGDYIGKGSEYQVEVYDELRSEADHGNTNLLVPVIWKDLVERDRASEVRSLLLLLAEMAPQEEAKIIDALEWPDVVAIERAKGFVAEHRTLEQGLSQIGLAEQAARVSDVVRNVQERLSKTEEQRHPRRYAPTSSTSSG